MQKRLKIFVAAVVVVALVAAPLAATSWFHQRDDRAADVWLGIQSQSVDYDIAEAFDLDVPYGVIINSVISDSPADEAGLKEGDVILAVNDHDVTDRYELEDALMHLDVGDEAVLSVNRGGSKLTVTVTVEKRPSRTMGLAGDGRIVVVSPDGRSMTVTDDWSHVKRGYLGVRLTELSDQLATYFGADKGGALVTEVEEDSPAERAGLMAGDVIVQIADEAIREADDVTDLLHDYRKGQEVTVNVLRRGQQQTISVTLDETRGGHFSFSQFDPSDFNVQIPDIDVRVPRINGNYWSDSDRRRLNDQIREELKAAQREVREELRDANDELREAMRQLQRELKEVQRKLD